MYPPYGGEDFMRIPRRNGHMSFLGGCPVTIQWPSTVPQMGRSQRIETEGRVPDACGFMSASTTRAMFPVPSTDSQHNLCRYVQIEIVVKFFRFFEKT